MNKQKRKSDIKMIKCIVCDLDGTLINKSDQIEEKTYQLLKECIDQGIEFIIATGRDINMVVDLLDRYQLDCDLVLNNGAQYRDRQNTINKIYPMDPQSFIKIANILHDYGYLLAIHTDKGKYSLHNQEDFWSYHMDLLHNSIGPILPKKTFTTREGYLRDFHYAKTPEDIIKQGINVLKIDARHRDAYSVSGIKQQLNIPYLDISSSYEDNIEITSNSSNKGLLLSQILKNKGYQNDEVAVFGDGENDSTMLQSFKYSFAPANASTHAKKVANYLLDSTHDQGAVYEGIIKLKQMNLL